jgi:hypothetical protein
VTALTDEELAEMEAMAGDLRCLYRLTEYERSYRGDVPRLVAALRASRAEVDDFAEALRLCMKDLQEHGVIFAPGDAPYDLLLAYDEGVGG